ncbi:hypothetical protein [Mesorhizobium sp.]|uniref:hypothetical protein n=1 Tax=Mesorhizobium sp. TaxID=1871066 RepID=UPI000FE4851C|nr:hypothetical protein [Mesorhizobium sp.]RWN11777.1 MAG: hypothetical protein EOR87_14760 [Mesorhizobium sp.]RWN19436.1 MAG: hypothetical protein EOR88_09805 [Mesorhizobium sp.]
MTILQACPFCGKLPKSKFFGDEDGGYWAVECYHQDSSHTTFCGVHGDDQATAEAAWNNRLLVKVGCQFRFMQPDKKWGDWNDGAAPEWLIRAGHAIQERALYAAEIPDGA